MTAPDSLSTPGWGDVAKLVTFYESNKFRSPKVTSPM